MLTKDLIRARVVRGYLKPQFVDPANQSLLALGEQLIDLYTQDGVTRGEIDESVSPLVNAQSDVRLAKGLNKLLQDRSDFDHALDLDYAALRKQLFRAGAELLQAPGELEPEQYQERVLAAAADLPESFVETGIYADLPENEVLHRFRALTPRQLLERYNVGLVQALLLRADSLEILCRSPDAAKLRRLFKYLKFFRLMGHLYRDEKDAQRVRLVVDGPASILSQSRKYGLQLASFFPAICALDEWEMKAQVEWKDRQRQLSLGHQLGLVCHYRNFSAYVPEEIRLFHDYFRDNVEHWTIVGDTPFIDAGNQEIIFPDLSFQHTGGTLIHLELFHRWHATQLEARLAYGAEHPETPLIIGVDRYLAKQQELGALLDASEWFATNGFLFRDYPTANRVTGTLDGVLDTYQLELDL